jgi:alpha-tubulin suppressor-like RCC1 family protein
MLKSLGYLTSSDPIQNKKVYIDENNSYKGLNTQFKVSRFSSMFIDPLYKFPVTSKQFFSCILEEADCYLPDAVIGYKFCEILHDLSPFKKLASKDFNNSSVLDTCNQIVPKNSISSNLNSVSFEKPFNITDEIYNEYESMDSSNLSLAFNHNIGLEKYENFRETKVKLKNPHKNNHLNPKLLQNTLKNPNSASSINLSVIKDSLISNSDILASFSNLELSAIESENKRLYQKVDEQIEIASNDEALYTGNRTDESIKANVFLVELVPENDEENSRLMYRSIEALKKAKLVEIATEEDAFSSFDDEGPLMVDTRRLFLNVETASKAKLSGEVSASRVIKKIAPKLLTDSSDLILSTVPETQSSIECPDMSSPLLKKLVALDCSNERAKIIYSTATSGFNSSLSIEYSGEDSKSKLLPYRKEKDLWLGLLSTPCLSLLYKTKVLWISCGFEHMAAVTAQGKVMTWGYGSSGCLGHGNTNTLVLPCIISSLSSERIVYLECGGYHNAAINDEGEVWVWGRGDVNQLGIDFTRLIKDEIGYAALSPIKIKQVSTTVIKSVACGEAHTLLLDSEGKVYSFGWAEDGQLGTNELDSSNFMSCGINCINSLQSKVIKISAGSTFSACVNELGQVLVWGNGEQGQLGQGVYVKCSKVPLSVNSINHEFIVDIVCGESHAMCISQTGNFYAWGQGTAGYFSDQTVYPFGSDIICFATRNIFTVRNAQEYLIKKKYPDDKFYF